MPSLSDRLQALGVKVGAENLPISKPRHDQEHSIEKILTGSKWRTPSGDVFYVETRYDAGMNIGNVGIRPQIPLDVIADWAQTPHVPNLELEKFAFIDIETTGLGGGAGTYAFLIGVGRFQADHFRLVQFFLQDPSQEVALLRALEEFLAPCEAVVSYNGKTFDVPIINNRYAINGFPPLLQNTPHLDLLHLARRIWKIRLASRTLGDIEAEILGIRRSEQDVPGWMVASIYFDYLKTGDARPLRGVFYHNEVDVISLAALLAHLDGIISHPLENPNQHRLELITIGKLYQDLGRLETAARIYQVAIEGHELPADVYWNTSKRLSFLFKRLGDLESARAIWEKAANQGYIFACEEIAKYYEHRERNFTKAAAWTDKALEIIAHQPESAIDRILWLEALEHRRSRLERKLLSNAAEIEPRKNHD
jgi:uncharacterized protein YprB with RNaseH-like and TPR domain